MLNAQRSRLLAALVFVGALVPSAAQPQSTVRNDLPQPYRTTRDWGQLPPGVAWAAVTAVARPRTGDTGVPAGSTPATGS